jgi:hypothetical protein
LWPEDVERLHELWLRLTAESEIGARLHHRDVVGLALQRLQGDLEGEKREEILSSIESLVQKHE